MKARERVTAFPTREESLALQASLLEGEAAIEAWRTLALAPRPARSGIPWITPLLMANVQRLLPLDPWVTENPHFLTLCDLKARAIREVAQKILRILEEAGVPSMALKGLALGVTVYASPGLRSVSDVDIAVPVKDLFRAMEALRSAGLRASPKAPRTPEDLRANHAHVFSSGRRHEPTLDLHWHVLASARGEDDDAPFWSGARPLQIGSVKTLSLCPEDQLLHVLVHGVRWTRMPHVRWVADATLILRSSASTFRTERFLEVAERFDAAVPVCEGLSYIARVLGEGRELLERARGLKQTAFSRKAFKARTTSYEDRTVTDRIVLRVETALWSRRAGRRPVVREGAGE